MTDTTPMIRVRPAPASDGGPDRLIRYPDQPARALPAEGGLVPDTSYWRRRLACGDVEMMPEE